MIVHRTAEIATLRQKLAAAESDNDSEAPDATN